MTLIKFILTKLTRGCFFSVFIFFSEEIKRKYLFRKHSRFTVFGTIYALRCPEQDLTVFRIRLYVCVSVAKILRQG